MKSGEISMNLKGLDELQRHLKAGSYARVGVIGDKAGEVHPDGITNAEIGLIAEYGTVDKDPPIPARSWLRFPIWFKEKELVKYVQSPAVMTLLLGGKVAEGLKLVGIFAETIIQEAFATRGYGQWKPNAPSTIDRKGSSMPLIDTAQFRRSVSSDVVIK